MDTETKERLKPMLIGKYKQFKEYENQWHFETDWYHEDMNCELEWFDWPEELVELYYESDYSTVCDLVEEIYPEENLHQYDVNSVKDQILKAMKMMNISHDDLLLYAMYTKMGV